MKLKQILFQKIYHPENGKPLFDNEPRLAETIYQVKPEQYKTPQTIQSHINQVLNGKRDLTITLKEMILEAVQSLEDKNGKLPVDKVVEDIEKATSNALKVGAGNIIFAAPVIYTIKKLQEEESQIRRRKKYDDDRILITTYGNLIGPNEYEPVFDLYPDKRNFSLSGLPGFSSFKRLDAINLIDMLQKDELDLICVVGDIYERRRTREMIRAAIIADTANSGVLLHIATKNAQVKARLDELVEERKQTKSELIRSVDDIHQLLNLLHDAKKMSGIKRPIPFFYIEGTISDRVGVGYFIDNSLNQDLRVFRAFNTNSFQWQSFLENANMYNQESETFAFVGWHPIINKLESEGKKHGDYTIYTHNLPIIKPPNIPPTYFTFDIVFKEENYKQERFRKKVHRFIEKLDEAIEDIRDRSFRFREGLTFIAEHLGMVDSGGIEKEEILWENLLRIRFNLKYYKEYIKLIRKD